MAITDNIITTAEVNALKVAAETRQRIQGEPDTVKAIIDRLPLKIVEKYNALIATLQKQTTGSGAEQIGCAAIPGVNDDESGTIREMLVSLKELINNAVISGLVTNSVDETYLTADAVMLSLLTDYAIASAGTPAALATTDTVAVALGKIERILSNILAGVQAAGKATDYSTSGGIATALAGKQNTLTWDEVPTAASNNPVRSYGLKAVVDAIYSALLAKENTSNKKTSLTDNSDTYYPTQKAVNTALALKAPLASPTFTGTVTVPTPTAAADAVNKSYVDNMVIKQPNKTYVLYHATAGTNNLHLSAATYAHTYAVAGAYLITISGTGSLATVDWGDGTSETVDFTGGFKVNDQTDKEKYIEVHLGTNCGGIGNDAFYGCTKLTSITIPNSVTSISSDAFYNCTSLTSITIPDSVTSISSNAFASCSSLTSITIPNSVTSISTDAFSYCTSLTSIIIPDSVTSIGNFSFSDCTSLTSIIIPDSVTSIGYRAFFGCTSLRTIDFRHSTLPMFGTDCFQGCRISDIIATSSENADSIATAVSNNGGTLLTNYRKLY